MSEKREYLWMAVLAALVIAALTALSVWAFWDWPAPVFFGGMGAVFGFIGGHLALSRAGRTRRR